MLVADIGGKRDARIGIAVPGLVLELGRVLIAEAFAWAAERGMNWIEERRREREQRKPRWRTTEESRTSYDPQAADEAARKT